ncbi:MAG TPA: serine/threonine-protein kinase [Thermoanaerobaculia bacterium]|nr:serine/threonine-protein kinase [Thermoanaerobaculia bacterium]
MTPERWARLKSLFADAVAAAADERARLLAGVEAEDPELARELAGLLVADPGDDYATDDLTVTNRAGRGVAAEALPGQIDRYVILGELGRGGMGRVLLAERADGAYRQKVALKILSGGRLASEEARRRFVAERQILARLSHPAIARLIDGGSTPEGEPFLVTEWIDGLPLDAYCCERKLDGEAVVRLFVEICDAVDSAHRALVVHRDLKPSNVVVTAEGEPKLLDFGIAKLLDPQAGEGAFETRYGYAPLTPRYASPEQVRGEPVTVATDVYSLGVVLFELLTGRSPYGDGPMTPAALAVAICEDDPPAPSTTVTTRDAGAGAPGEPPPVRRRWLAGDLDAIVLRALQKDPQRRYGSVAALGADLRRFLAGEPVEARRPTLAYRASRWVGRHRLATAAALLLLVIGVLFVVQRERQLEATRRERDKAEAVLGLLVEVFGEADPQRAQGRSITVEQALDRGAAQAQARLRHDSLAEATLLDAIGTVYSNLGLYDRAAPLLQRALALRRSSYPPGSLEIAEVERHLGELELRRGDYRPARARLESALAAYRRHPGREAAISALLVDLAQLETEQEGDVRRAERLAREALAMQQRALDAADPQMAATLDVLGSLAYGRGAYSGAERHFRDGLALRRRALGEEHPATIQSMDNLANALYARGRTAESVELFQRVVAARRRVLGDRHPEVAVGLNNLGSTFSAEGRFAEAEPLLREATEIAAAALAPNHLAHGTYLGNLAQAVQGLGRLQEAEALLRRALAATEKALGGEHQDTAMALHNLAANLGKQGRFAAAEPLYRRALDVYARTLPPDHDFPSFTQAELARLAIRRGDGAEAERLLRQALAVRRRVLDAGHWRVAVVELALGQALALQGRADEGVAISEAAWQRMASALGRDNPRAREAAEDVGRTWERLGRGDAGVWRQRAEAAAAPSR